MYAVNMKIVHWIKNVLDTYELSSKYIWFFWPLCYCGFQENYDWVRNFSQVDCVLWTNISCLANFHTFSFHLASSMEYYRKIGVILTFVFASSGKLEPQFRKKIYVKKSHPVIALFYNLFGAFIFTSNL